MNKKEWFWASVVSLALIFLLITMMRAQKVEPQPSPTSTPPYPQITCLIVDQHISPQDFASVYWQRKPYGHVQWAIDNVGDYTIVVEEDNCTPGG